MAANTRPGGSYVSNGQMLESPPLYARFNRAVDNAYNFFGLYFVSLFSLDPYVAAQNSQFNTMSRGPNAYQNRPRWGAGSAARPSGGPNGGSGNSRPGGSGGGSGGGAGSGRRMGTVDDVRGPECGSCG